MAPKYDKYSIISDIISTYMQFPEILEIMRFIEKMLIIKYLKINKIYK